MEQLALAPDVMRKRVEETLDLLGIAELRNRALRTLSGGQQQRVAIGSVLTAHPRVLVLDEPTSALDPTAAEEVLAAVTRLVHDLGVTVVIAEHRLERVVQYADRVLYLHGDGTVASGAPAGRARHQQRRAAGGAARPARRVVAAAAVGARRPPARRSAARATRRISPPPARDAGRDRAAGAPRHAASWCVYGQVVAVREVDLELSPADRSSRSWGATAPASPRCSGRSRGPAAARAERSRSSAPTAVTTPPRSAPRMPGDWSGSCRRHRRTCCTCRPSPRSAPRPTVTPGIRAARLPRCSTASFPTSTPTSHPRDLSEGQRLALVLAVQLSASPDVVLLDEPTRGLDYHAKERFGTVVRELADEGRAVVVATHDVEFVAVGRGPGGRAGRGRGRRRRPDRRRDGGLPRVRPPGRQDHEPAAVADSRRRSPRALGGRGRS